MTATARDALVLATAGGSDKSSAGLALQLHDQGTDGSSSGMLTAPNTDVIRFLQKQYGIPERRRVTDKAGRALAALQQVDRSAQQLTLERDVLPKIEARTADVNWHGYSARDLAACACATNVHGSTGCHPQPVCTISTTSAS